MQLLQFGLYLWGYRVLLIPFYEYDNFLVQFTQILKLNSLKTMYCIKYVNVVFYKENKQAFHKKLVFSKPNINRKDKLRIVKIRTLYGKEATFYNNIVL